MSRNINFGKIAKGLSKSKSALKSTVKRVAAFRQSRKVHAEFSAEAKRRIDTINSCTATIMELEPNLLDTNGVERSRLLKKLSRLRENLADLHDSDMRWAMQFITKHKEVMSRKTLQTAVTFLDESYAKMEDSATKSRGLSKWKMILSAQRN
jgi:predicted RNA-binding protein with EMAP domain